MTPNTAVYLTNVGSSEKLVFICSLHKPMREYSDGAGLIVWILDEQNNIVYEHEIMVTNEDNWKEYQIMLDKYGNVKSVKILCNNGSADSDNDSGDWVLIDVVEDVS